MADPPMISFRRESHAPFNRARGGLQPVYAIGDIHGRYDLLHALLGEIRRDAATDHPGALPTLILCGDYIDRGPASAEVLAALVWLRRSAAIDTKVLRGNHEAMLQDFLNRPAEHGLWLSTEGHTTLRSYGIILPDDSDLKSAAVLTRARDSLLDVMPISHYDLLQNLELYCTAGDYTFVHAGVAPGIPLASQVPDDLLWIREEFLNHPQPLDSIVVHGHTWRDDRAQVLPHRIGIDTGAYATGVLTALHLADDTLEIIQAVGAKGAHHKLG